MSELYHDTPEQSTKVCSTCFKEKPLSEFYHVSKITHAHLYRTECKACTLTQQRIKHHQKRNKKLVQFSLFPISKICTKCKIEKPIDQFGYGNPYTPDGYNYRCRDCLKEDAKGRSQKIAHLPASKVCSRCHTKKLLEQFPISTGYGKYGRASICYECAQERWQENKEKYTATSAKWRKANPLKDLRRSQSYTARKKKATTIDPVDYEHILERDGLWCYICEHAILPGQKMHFDHVIPLARGGEHTEDNLKPTHHVCNVRKQDKLLSEMTPFQRRGV